MAVIGIYDWDYMHYQHVIPNLEVAKLCTYFYNQKQIAILTDKPNYDKYSSLYIQKDYDDGIYPSYLSNEKIIYGGRAFSNGRYKPLPDKIERTIPDMHIYDQFIDKYCVNKTDKAQIKHLLNCAHIRLSSDGHNIKTFKQLKSIMSTKKYTGLILHDYNIGELNGAIELIKQFSNEFKYRSMPMQVGNKFPIIIDSEDVLSDWLSINVMNGVFFIQYNGILSNNMVQRLCEDNSRFVIQMCYNFAPNDENFFIENELSKIYKQILFFRNHNLKILLGYDKQKIKNPQLRRLFDLLNCWLSFKWQDNFIPIKQTLYNFARGCRKFNYNDFCFRNVTVQLDEIRDIFNFFYHKNYNIFRQFYELDKIVYKDGEFIDGWQ